MKIDVNSDMGEGFGIWQVCDDTALIDHVSSANIACGFHAGDPSIMTRMVRMARERGVGIGAHPGFPDRQGFGRREHSYSAEEICQQVIYQFGALQGIANAEGTRIAHLSFHAAMGNQINRDRQLALQVMQAVSRIDPQVIVFCMADTIIESAARAAGLPTLTLFLVDRAYQQEGRLVPRGQPGAVITAETQVRARVRQFLDKGTVTTIDGDEIAVRAGSILIHSDTPGSVELAGLVCRQIPASCHTPAPAAEDLSPY